MTTSSIYVWKWLPGATEPVVAGELRIAPDGGQAFAYGRSFLQRENAATIYGAELTLRQGTQVPIAGLNHFSGLRDGAPDAWGRRVIHARLLGRANLDPGSILDEATYLLQSGSDRIGALDFQESSSEYVPREPEAASLQDLQDAAELLSRGLPIPPDLTAALFHGSSIGGARPKAAIAEKDAKYIAKFSVSDDTYDVVRAEYIAMTLAAECGLDVAEAALQPAGNREALLVRRFDRSQTAKGWTRQALVSGLTVLGLDERWAREASYPQLADQLRLSGLSFKTDARELFSRMVFNVLIGNTDDHARNHAFFVEGESIRLTPAYDLCPFPRAGGEASHGMKLFKNSNLSRIELCVAGVGEFGLSEEDALGIIANQIDTIANRFSEICIQIAMPRITESLLWRRAILNPDIFSGRYDFLGAGID